MDKDASLFVVEAALAAGREVCLPGEAEADRLLAQARAAIYHWPVDFTGFQAELTLLHSGRVPQVGRIHAASSRTLRIEGEFEPDHRWLKFQLEELLSHRESPEVSKMANKTGARFGDHDELYGQQILLAGDSMKSYYRVQDSKLTQIGRQYRSQDLLINIDQHHSWRGRFAAANYTAFYRALDGGELRKVETYLDEYTLLGPVYLPIRRRVTCAESGGIQSREIRLSGWEFLP